MISFSIIINNCDSLSLIWQFWVFFISLWAALAFWPNFSKTGTLLCLKNLKFFHFFLTVTHVITFGLHNLKKFLFVVVFLKILVSQNLNIVISSNKNMFYNPTLLCLCQLLACSVTAKQMKCVINSHLDNLVASNVTHSFLLTNLCCIISSDCACVHKLLA